MSRPNLLNETDRILNTFDDTDYLRMANIGYRNPAVSAAAASRLVLETPWDIQVYDAGLHSKNNQPFTFIEDNQRDPESFFSMNLINNRTTWRSGMYGSSPLAVNYDMQMAGLKTWEDADEPWLKTMIDWSLNPVGQSMEELVIPFFTWDFSEVRQMVDIVDSNFKSIETDGFKTAIDEAFGDQADMTRKALQQHGWVAEETARGARNAGAYIYAVKRRLRDIAYQQWAEHKMWIHNAEYNKEMSDPRHSWQRFVLDIVTDYELLVDIPVTLGLGLLSKPVTIGGKILTHSGKVRTAAANISKGKYVGYSWAKNPAGKKIGLDLQHADATIVRLNMMEAEGLRNLGLMPAIGTEITTGIDVMALKPTTRVMTKDQLTGRWATSPGNLIGTTGRIPVGSGQIPTTTILNNPLAPGTLTNGKVILLPQSNFIKAWEKKAIAFKSLGWSVEKFGSVMQFLAFMDGARTISYSGRSLMRQFAAGGVWGATTGQGFSRGMQADEKLMADIYYGEGQHDIAFSYGRLITDSVLFGTIGAVLGGILGSFVGGYWSSWFKDGPAKYGWKPSKKWFNGVMGKHETEIGMDTLEEIVLNISESQAMQYLTKLIDQFTGNNGAGALLLDKTMIRGHKRLYIEVAEFISNMRAEMDNAVMSYDILEEAVIDFIKQGLHARKKGASNAEIIAQNHKIGRQLAQEAKKKAVKSGKTGHTLYDLDLDAFDEAKLLAQPEGLEKFNNAMELKRKALVAQHEAKVYLDTFTPVPKEVDAKYRKALKQYQDYIEDFPVHPKDVLAEAKYKDYDYATAGPGGVLIGNAIKRRREIQHAVDNGMPKEEIGRRKAAFIEALELMDESYPHRKSIAPDSGTLTREEVQANRLTISFTELRKKHDGGTDWSDELRKDILSILVKQLGGSLPAGEKAMSHGWFNKIMNEAGFGEIFTQVASFGSGYREMTYNTFAIIRQLAEMIDNSHEALVSDVANFGRMRSVYTAQRQAMRDTNRIHAAANSAERDIGSTLYRWVEEQIHNWYGNGFTKDLTREEIRAAYPQFTDEAIERILGHYLEVRVAVKKFFDKYDKLGKDTQFFHTMKKMEDEAEGYLPLMVSDVMKPKHVEEMGKQAYAIKAQKYLDNDFMSIVEIAEAYHFEVQMDHGIAVGITRIEKPGPDGKGGSPLWIPGMDEKELRQLWWKFFQGADSSKLNLIDHTLQQARKERGLEVYTKDGLELMDEPVATGTRLGLLDPVVVERHLENTKKFLNEAIANNQLATAGQSLYRLMRQSQDWAASNPRAALDAMSHALQIREVLKTKHGVEITDPYGKLYIGQDWVPVYTVPATKKTQAAGKIEYTVTRVDSPEIKVNDVIITRAEVTLDPNIKPHELPTIRHLEELDVTLMAGDFAVHTPVKGEKAISDAPLEIARIETISHKSTIPTTESSVTVKGIKINFKSTVESALWIIGKGDPKSAAKIKELKAWFKTSGVDDINTLAKRFVRGVEKKVSNATIDQTRAVSPGLGKAPKLLKVFRGTRKGDPSAVTKSGGMFFSSDEGFAKFYGKTGTFYVDPKQLKRISLKEWDEMQLDVAPHVVDPTKRTALLKQLEDEGYTGVIFETPAGHLIGKGYMLWVPQPEGIVHIRPKDAPRITKGLELTEPVSVKGLVDITIPETTTTVAHVKGIKEPIPVSELTHVNRASIFSQEVDSLPDSLAYHHNKPISTSTPESDYFVIGMEGLAKYVSEITGQPTSALKLGFGGIHSPEGARYFFKNSGLMPHEVLDLLNRDLGFKFHLALASKHNIDIGIVVTQHINELARKLRKQNQTSVHEWIAKQEPVIPGNHNSRHDERMLKSREQLKALQRASETEDFSPEEQTLLVYLSGAEYDNIPDLKTLAADIEGQWSAYERQVAEWNNLSMDDILTDIHIIKTKMVQENMELMRVGERPIHSRDTIEAAIEAKYPDIKFKSDFQTLDQPLGRETQLVLKQIDDARAEEVLQKHQAKAKNEVDNENAVFPSDSSIKSRGQTHRTKATAKEVELATLQKLFPTETLENIKANLTSFRQQRVKKAEREAFVQEKNQKLSIVRKNIKALKQEIGDLDDVIIDPKVLEASEVILTKQREAYDIIAGLEDVRFTARNPKMVGYLEEAIETLEKSMKELRDTDVDLIIKNHISKDLPTAWHGKTAAEFKNKLRNFKRTVTMAENRVAELKANVKTRRTAHTRKAAQNTATSAVRLRNRYRKELEKAQGIWDLFESPQTIIDDQMFDKLGAISDLSIKLVEEQRHIKEVAGVKNSIEKQHNIIRKLGQDYLDLMPATRTYTEVPITKKHPKGHPDAGKVITTKAGKPKQFWVKRELGKKVSAEDLLRSLQLDEWWIKRVGEMATEQFNNPRISYFNREKLIKGIPTEPREVSVFQLLRTPIASIEAGHVVASNLENAAIKKAKAETDRLMKEAWFDEAQPNTMGEFLGIWEGRFGAEFKRSEYAKLIKVIRSKANNQLESYEGARQMQIALDDTEALVDDLLTLLYMEDAKEFDASMVRDFNFTPIGKYEKRNLTKSEQAELMLTEAPPTGSAVGQWSYQTYLSILNSLENKKITKADRADLNKYLKRNLWYYKMVRKTKKYPKELEDGTAHPKAGQVIKDENGKPKKFWTSVQRKGKDRIKTGPDTDLNVGVFINKAAKYVQKYYYRLHKSDLHTNPNLAKAVDPSMEGVTRGSLHGERGWMDEGIDLPARKYDPFSGGDSWGHPIRTMMGTENKEITEKAIQKYFQIPPKPKSDDLQVLERWERKVRDLERQESLVRLLLNSDQDDPKVYHAVQYEDPAKLRLKQDPITHRYISKVKYKIHRGRVAELLRKQGHASATENTVYYDLNRIGAFIKSFGDAALPEKMYPSLFSQRQWTQKDLNALVKHLLENEVDPVSGLEMAIGRPAAELYKVDWTAIEATAYKGSMLERHNAFVKEYTEAAAPLLSGPVPYDRRYKETKAVLTRLHDLQIEYEREFRDFLDDIFVFAPDAHLWIERELGEANRIISELEKDPTIINLMEHESILKRGWARQSDLRQQPKYIRDALEVSTGDEIKLIVNRTRRVILEEYEAKYKADPDVLVSVPIEVINRMDQIIRQPAKRVDVFYRGDRLPSDGDYALLEHLVAYLNGDTVVKRDLLAVNDLIKTADFKFLKKVGLIETGGTRGWRLTTQGREWISKEEINIIKVQGGAKFDPVWKKLKKTVRYRELDPDGFTVTDRNRLAQLEENLAAARAKDQPDLTTIGLYQSEIYNIINSATNPTLKEANNLMHQLVTVTRELEAIRRGEQNIKEARPQLADSVEKAWVEATEKAEVIKAGPMGLPFIEATDVISFKGRSVKLKEAYFSVQQRGKELEILEAKLIKKLQDLLGTSSMVKKPTMFINDPSHSVFKRTSEIAEDTNLKPHETVEEVPSGIAPAKSPFDDVDIYDLNVNYKGHADPVSAANKVRDAYNGSKKWYDISSEKRYGDLNNGHTALRAAMYGWAEHMNHEKTSRRSDPFDAYRNPDGDPHLGSNPRVFSTQEVMSHPEFRKMFEGDFRKLSAHYARTLGAQIRAQEVLNDWLTHLGVATTDRQLVLKNIRWNDIFEQIKIQIDNLNDISMQAGKGAMFTQEQREILKGAVEVAEKAYMDMIGRPMYKQDKTRTLEKTINIINHTAQSMFGPGISTAVGLVEIPMAILARTGDLGGLAKGMGILARDFTNMGSPDMTELAGTAFVLENYMHSGIHRYDHMQALDMEYKMMSRIRKSWSHMFEGADPNANLGSRIATNLDNFLEGTAKIGGEITFLRHTILMVKNIAVGKAKYEMMVNFDKLMDFSSKLDINELEKHGVMRSNKDYNTDIADLNIKYIKSVAREVGLNESLAFRWFRAGLAGDNKGNNLNEIISHLLEMGGATKEGFNFATIYKNLEDVDLPYGRIAQDLYDDTFDRLALFIEMHAHDLSPEPRGLSKFHLYDSAIGRALSFYISYPLAFFMTYMKKHPSEMGSLAALTTLLTITGFEMFHQQVRALMRGEDPSDLAEKWQENPWAMLFREGSHTPWFGYSHNLLRGLSAVPLANNFIGDNTYPSTIMQTAGASAVEKGLRGVQEAFKGNILTRPRQSNSRQPRLNDYLMTGFDLQDPEGNSLQASYLTSFIYEVLFPSRAFWWQGTEAVFHSDFSPTDKTLIETIFRAWGPTIQDLIKRNPKGAEELILRIAEAYLPKQIKEQKGFAGYDDVDITDYHRPQPLPAPTKRGRVRHPGPETVQSSIQSIGIPPVTQLLQAPTSIPLPGTLNP